MQSLSEFDLYVTRRFILNFVCVFFRMPSLTVLQDSILLHLSLQLLLQPLTSQLSPTPASQPDHSLQRPSLSSLSMSLHLHIVYICVIVLELYNNGIVCCCSAGTPGNSNPFSVQGGTGSGQRKIKRAARKLKK